MKKLTDVSAGQTQPKLRFMPQWVSGGDIAQRIESELEKTLRVLMYTGQLEVGDDRRIRNTFWSLARKHEINGKYMLGRFAVLLGAGWVEMQRLKEQICKEKGIEAPAYFVPLWGESSGCDWSAAKGGIAQSILDGDGEIRAIFVPFNAMEAGRRTEFLFANGDAALPYDDYANKHWHGNEYADTQVAFAARVKAAYGFDTLDHRAFDALWVVEALSSTAEDIKNHNFSLGEPARWGERVGVGDDSMVADVSIYCGSPRMNGDSGAANSCGGVAFVDELEIGLTPRF